MHSSIYLDLLIVVPLLGALAAMLVRKVPNASFLAGVATSVLEFALSVVVFVLYNNHLKGAGTFDFLSRHVLSAPLGLAWDVGIDGISLILIMLTTIVLPLALYGARERRQESSFVAWMLVLTAFTVGQLHQPRRARVLHLLRAHSRAELLHHRGLGRGAARPGRAQVLHLHLWRVGVLVHRRLVPGLPPPAPDRGSADLLGHAHSPRRSSPTALRCGCSSPSRWPSR